MDKSIAVIAERVVGHDFLRDGVACTICGKYCPHVVGKLSSASNLRVIG